MDFRESILQELSSRMALWIKRLQQLVELESPTTSREGVNRVGRVVADWARELGAKVEVVKVAREDRGDHVIATWRGTGGRGALDRDGPVVVLAHLDTVWPLGEVVRRPFRIRGDHAYGPGVYDMKASIIMLLAAIELAQARGTVFRRDIRALFTSDEEIGSWTSRDLIRRECRRAAAVLVLEPAEEGRLITSRKGQLQFTIRAYGRAAHAGMSHHKGVNAIEELAHHILHVQSLTDYGRGVTLSCGVVQGGTRTNVIPAEATVTIDARVPNVTEGERLISLLSGIRPRLDGARVRVEHLWKRTPLVRHEGVARLFELAVRCANELGCRVEETCSGGISDANLVADLGVPILDGLGAVGDGAHSVDEHIHLPSLKERTALLLKLLETV